MRKLTREEAHTMDINFIYGDGSVIALIEKDFDKKFEILRRDRND